MFVSCTSSWVFTPIKPDPICQEIDFQFLYSNIYLHTYCLYIVYAFMHLQLQWHTIC